MGGADSLGEEGTAEAKEYGHVTWIRAGGSKNNGAGRYRITKEEMDREQVVEMLNEWFGSNQPLLIEF